MKLSNVKVLVSRTRNYEKLEIEAEVSVNEGEKLKEIVSKLHDSLDVIADNEFEKIVARQEKEKALEEEVKKANKMPETMDEAKAVIVDGKPLNDFSFGALNEAMLNYRENTKEGIAIRILLGKSNSSTVETPSSEKFESFKSFFKNGDNTVLFATQKEIDFIRKTKFKNEQMGKKLLNEINKALKSGKKLNWE